MGIIFRVAGSSWETWNMGCMDFIESGSQIVKDSDPTQAMIGYGLRFFSASFFKGLVNLKYLALTYTKSLI